MASADDNFFPAVFVASMGSERGFSEKQISEALEKLKRALTALEKRLGTGASIWWVGSPCGYSSRGQLRPPAQACGGGWYWTLRLPECRRSDGEDRSPRKLQSFELTGSPAAGGPVSLPIASPRAPRVPSRRSGGSSGLEAWSRFCNSSRSPGRGRGAQR